MKKLHASRFNLAQHERNVWHVLAEAGTTTEDLLRPGFWTHIAAKLRPRDKIEVFADDGSYYAELVVRYTTSIEASVALTNIVQFEEAPAEGLANPVSDYRIEHKGFGRWRVARLADKAVVRDDFPSKEDAQKWLDGHVKALAA